MVTNLFTKNIKNKTITTHLKKRQKVFTKSQAITNKDQNKNRQIKNA